MEGEQFGLRSDVGKNNCVTTVIESDADMERDVERGGQVLKKKQSVDIKLKGSAGQTGRGQWTNSVTKLTDDSSEETDLDWRAGIRKTTVQTRMSSS